MISACAPYSRTTHYWSRTAALDIPPMSHNKTQSGAAKSFRLHWKGWSVVLCAVASLAGTRPLVAQNASSACSSIHNWSKPLTYPPIARAAHEEGIVELLVSFRNDGSLLDQQVLSGPNILRSAAISFARGLRVVPFDGKLECREAITFSIAPGSQQCPVLPRDDAQHFATCTEVGETVTTFADGGPPGHVSHRFLFFRWKTLHINS